MRRSRLLSLEKLGLVQEMDFGYGALFDKRRRQSGSGFR